MDQTCGRPIFPTEGFVLISTAYLFTSCALFENVKYHINQNEIRGKICVTYDDEVEKKFARHDKLKIYPFPSITRIR